MKPKPIKERIRDAFEGERRLSYHQLATKVFPRWQFPNAWRYRTGGGPPGCYMALSRALREMKVGFEYEGNKLYVYSPR